MQPLDSNTPATTYTQGSEYGVRVASRMERFSDTYSLIISSANKWEDRCAANGWWRRRTGWLAGQMGASVRQCSVCVCTHGQKLHWHWHALHWQRDVHGVCMCVCSNMTVASIGNVSVCVKATARNAYVCLCLSLAVVSVCREVMMQASVAAYFHSDGYLAHHKFTKDVAKLLKQYELLDASSAPRPKALTPGKQD